VFQATVEHLSAQGFGTIRDSAGITYFVRSVWPGDVGVFTKTEERSDRYQFAELVSLISVSPERRENPCPHFGIGETRCYGCPWIIANKEAQERRKVHRLRYALARVGLEATALEDLWPAQNEFSYRTRAQFKTDGTQIGYAGLKGSAIAPIDTCLVLSQTLQAKLKALHARLPDPTWAPGPGYLWNFLDVDESDHSLQLNRRRPFAQANALQNSRMKQWVKAQVQGEAVLELFCGSGNFTEVIAEEKRRIYAFEVGAEATFELQKKALPGVTVRRLDLYKSSSVAALADLPVSTLLVNPPRAGLLNLYRLTRLNRSIRSVVYISCDVQTLATDLKKLSLQGFHISILQPLDQMPQTPHLEVLVRLDRFS
jgi:23S rRNA (uracil1939-C5)-methyltransferase